MLVQGCRVTHQGERYYSHETILDCVQRAPNDIQWIIDQCEFDEMMATKKESAPGPDGIPYCTKKKIYIQVCVRVGWDLNSCSTHTDSSWKVALSPHVLLRAGPFFIPKSSTVDDNGLIARSPDA